MSDIANLGFSVNTSGLISGEKALDKFQKTGENTEKKIASQGKNIGKAFGGVGRNAGMAGIQVQQFVGQLQGGQSAMVALAQQSADLGFVLGAPMAGVLVSLGAVLAGVLVPSLMNTKDTMEELDEISSQLKISFGEAADGSDVLSKHIEKLADRSEALARLQISSSIVDAGKLIEVATTGIIDSLDDMEGAFNGAMSMGAAYDTIMSYSGALDEMPDKIQGMIGKGGFASLSAKLDEVGREFGVSRQSALEYIMVLGDLKNDQSPLAIKALENQLVKMNDETGGASEKINELSKILIPLFETVSGGVDKTNLLRQAFADLSNVLETSSETSDETDKTIERITTGLEGQIVALEQGAEAATKFGIAQTLGLESIKQIPPEILNLIETITRLKDEANAADFFDQASASLDLQRQKLQLTSEEFEIYKIKMQAIASKVAPELIAVLVKATKENQKLKKSLESGKELDKLTKDVERFGGAWSKTGSVIIDAFGDMSDALGDYMARVEEIGKLEARVAEARLEYGEDNAEVIKLQRELDGERISAELAGMKNIASATGSMFAEKTAAAKAFAALSKIIAVAEIALSYQKIVASNAETATHVANETTKTGANALTAITSAFAAPFPVNFIAGAAMIGIMAGLLGSVFGGGGGVVDPTAARQDSQGTGSLLGSDEKSKSIEQSQERYEDIAIDQLFELRGIRDSINSLSSGITSLATSIVGNVGTLDFEGSLDGSRFGESSLGQILSGEFLGIDFGGIGESFLTGLFGKTTKKIIDNGIQFVGQSLGQIIDQGIVNASAYFDIEVKKKKLFGLSSSTSLETETQGLGAGIQQQMAAIFGFIGDTVLESASLLGFETVNILKRSIGSGGFGNFEGFDPSDLKELGGRFWQQFTPVFESVEVSLEEALSEFEVNIGKVSFEGLSGEEIEQELQAIFSQQSDLIAEYLVPSIKEYQQIGEGLFDTLTRVTKEQVVFNDQIAKMGFSLESLSGIMKIDVAQSLIQLTGGFENFTDLTSSFVDNFFSETEQFAFLESSLSDVFNSLGMSLVDNREEFKNLVKGIDITTSEGQQLLATLLEINPALDDYIKKLEEIEEERVDMSITLLELQGKSEEALAAKRQLELDALDESLVSLQRLIFAEQDRIAIINEQESAIRNSFSALQNAISLEKQRVQAVLDGAGAARDAEIERVEGLRSSLNESLELLRSSYAESESMLRSSISIEKQRAKAVLDSALSNRNIEIQRVSGLRKELELNKSIIEKNNQEAARALQDSFQREMDRIKEFSDFEINSIQANSEARINALKSESDAIESTASSMRSLVDSINSSLGLSGGGGLIEALKMARSGDFTAAESLDFSSLSNISSEGFSSAEEMAVQQALNKNRLKIIGDLAEDKLSGAERMINAINRQIISTESSSESQMKAIVEESEKQISELQSQLNALLGIDESVISIDEAIEAFKESQEALESLNYENEISALNALVENANEAYELEKQSYSNQIELLDSQLNLLLGIDEGVLSLSDAIEAFKTSQADLENINYEGEIAKLDLMIQSANEVYALHEQAYADEIQRLDEMLSDNESLLNAALGIDGSVQSVAQAIDSLKGAINALEETASTPVYIMPETTTPEPVVEDIPKPTTINPSDHNFMRDLSHLLTETKSSDIVEAVKEMNVQNAQFQHEIVKNTKSAAKLLQRFELNGLDTRTIP